MRTMVLEDLPTFDPYFFEVHVGKFQHHGAFGNGKIKHKKWQGGKPKNRQVIIIPVQVQFRAGNRCSVDHQSTAPRVGVKYLVIYVSMAYLLVFIMYISFFILMILIHMNYFIHMFIQVYKKYVQNWPSMFFSEFIHGSGRGAKRLSLAIRKSGSRLWHRTRRIWWSWRGEPWIFTMARNWAVFRTPVGSCRLMISRNSLGILSIKIWRDSWDIVYQWWLVVQKPCWLMTNHYL